MRRLFSVLGILLIIVPAVAFSAAPSITRKDGFLLLWNSLRRSVTDQGKPFEDLKDGDGAREITFAKGRKIFDEPEDNLFHPSSPLTLEDALTWLFRTRNVDDPDQITPKTLSGYLLRYPIARISEGDEGKQTLTDDQILSLMRNLDKELVEEVHEVSLYGEDFHGHGTAFGETFDMDSLTAAHRTFPQNTLVKVTNRDNGQSVTVRINDRGPYVKGRDMDLSLAAFLQLAPRSAGVLRNVTFQRLGDANLVGPCVNEPAYQSRITKDTRLLPGIPHFLKSGAPLNLHGPQSFVVRRVTYPDGNSWDVQDWILPGENFHFVPSIEGQYTFLLAAKDGKRREMEMNVVRCGE